MRARAQRRPNRQARLGQFRPIQRNHQVPRAILHSPSEKRSSRPVATRMSKRQRKVALLFERDLPERIGPKTTPAGVVPRTC
jgi:hypothetical protein